jgi:hypothetical protein
MFQRRQQYIVRIPLVGADWTVKGYVSVTQGIGWRTVTVYEKVYKMLTPSSDYCEERPEKWYYAHRKPIAEISCGCVIEPVGPPTKESLIAYAYEKSGTWWQGIKVAATPLPEILEREVG